ncbi:MAG: SdpI family protein [Clostridia bacterium]|nr:SdpI family protein [Clostridia bacterium]
MWKANKAKLILSSLGILLPIFVGLSLWNQLPEQVPTHWGPDGNPDGFSSRPVAVFLLPLIVFAIHWLCLLVTSKDTKNKDQHRKVFNLIWWICPVVSWFAGGIMYATVLGADVPVGTVAFLLMGFAFIVIGNYLPKCKQNRTLGIKLPWTLADEGNWNATHRIGGITWVIGGIVCILSAFLPQTALPFVFILLLVIMMLIPTVYSYRYHKTHQQNHNHQ